MKTEKSVQAPQKPQGDIKTEKGTETTKRIFKSRDEAIQAATEAKKKGMPASIGIERGGYKLI